MIPTFFNDFKAFKMLLEKVIAVVVEIAIKLELEVEPKDVIESLSISWGIFSEWGVAFYKWLKKKLYQPYKTKKF